MRIMIAKKQIIPSSLTLDVKYPQSFLDLFENQQYQETQPFIGYGNPNAKILILGKEVTWSKESQEHEYKRYCADNFSDWQTNIERGNSITIKSQVLYPEDDVHSEAFENFNPLFPHYFNFNKLDNRRHITEINGKFTHQNLEYGASTTWFRYQKLIQYIYPNRPKTEYIDFFYEAFITEMSSESRRNNSKQNLTSDDRVATCNSIKERCHLLKEPFFQSFPIKIFACGGYSDLIFPYLYGFKKSDFEKKGWFSILGKRGQLFVCTWQFSARISTEMLKELASVIRLYL